MMLDAQATAYGDGLDPEHRHQYMWAVKPHYFTPFYNWPYTFGLLFGIGLYAKYIEDPERFRAGYDDLLSAHRDGRRRDAHRPVRLRRARPGVLGVEPRGDRPPHRRLRAPGRRRRLSAMRRRRAARGGRGATVHRLGLLRLRRSHAGRTAVGLHADRARRGAASRPICSTWARAEASGWPTLPFRPRCTIATEAWPPNVAGRARGTSVRSVCRSYATRAQPTTTYRPRTRRVDVCRSATVPSISSSTATRRSWPARWRACSRRTAIFVTQQVDNGNLDDLFGLLERDGARLDPSWLPLAVEQIAGAGLEITDARAGVETYRFADVGALAWYVAAVGPLHADWADVHDRRVSRRVRAARRTGPSREHRSRSVNAGCSCGRAARTHAR